VVIAGIPKDAWESGRRNFSEDFLISIRNIKTIRVHGTAADDPTSRLTRGRSSPAAFPIEDPGASRAMIALQSLSIRWPPAGGHLDLVDFLMTQKDSWC